MRLIQANIFLYFFLILLAIGGFFVSVIWPQIEGLYGFIAFAAAGGFGVAFYIFRTRSAHKQLVCPVGSDCNAVVNSRYARFLGIHLEYYGMAYYSIIFLSYITLIFAPHLFSNLMLTALGLLTAAAFFFSLYLLFVQAFLLRQWCIWCLLSAMLSTGIFIVSLASVDFAVEFLAEISIVLGAIHTLGFVIGMGTVTAAIFLFIRFLSDHDIDDSEMSVLKGFAELVWLGLILSLVSQFAFYVAYTKILAESGLFLTQTIALFVVAVSVAVIMIIFAPFMSMIPFAKTQTPSMFKPLRKPLFLTGAVMFSSWYFAFFMNYLPPDIKAKNLLFSYAIVIVISLFVALIWERGVGASSMPTQTAKNEE